MESKTCYDYLLLILPITLAALSTIGSWIFTLKINKITFSNIWKKEEYNELKKAAKNINESFIKFYKYCNSFINKSIKLYMCNMEMSEYDLSQFSSTKMLKINDIFSKIEIDFPEIKYNQQEYMNKSNGIEMFFAKMKNNQAKKDIDIYSSEITRIGTILNNLTKESNDLLCQIKISLSNRRLQFENKQRKK